MGKRVAAARVAKVEVSFGERLASLLKAAGFMQWRLLRRRQCLRMRWR